jgi:flagellar motor protein MotB
MLNEDQNLDGHERFKELNALANSGTLSAHEWLELERHLEVCNDCREIHDQYQILTSDGMPFLAAIYDNPQEREDWDDSEARKKLLARVHRAEQRVDRRIRNAVPREIPPHLLLGLWTNHWAKGGLAACLGIAIAFGAYALGSRSHSEAKQTSPSFSPQEQAQKLEAQKKSSDQLVESQAAKISQIQEQNAKQEQEVVRLRTALRSLEDHSRELGSAEDKTEQQLRAVSEQRNSLTVQLQQAEQSFQSAKSELASLRAENDRELLHAASLESKIDELTASNRDQERRLGNDEQFLASDRDIRELMGARKLYIADVFDVDSGSRTRKPYGRVFYTQNKSLIFYAFDLDHQAGVKNASIFQVWGQKEAAELGEKARPMNLGILYMDSESNRRWVLRLDDAKQMAEVDAVFVTVEPHGGSPKPTGKPFLYALLRKEANHP